MIKKICSIKFIVLTIFIIVILSLYSIYSSSKEEIDIEYGIGYGNPNAEIKMIEYMSFQCTDCFELHKNIGDTLKDKIKNGEIYYVLKHVDFDKFKYDDVIFKSIDNIDQIETIDFIMENYHIWNEMKSIEEVKQFFKLEDTKKDRVEMQNKILKEKDQYEIDFIPTFYLNGNKHVGVFTDKEFNEMINDLK